MMPLPRKVSQGGAKMKYATDPPFASWVLRAPRKAAIGISQCYGYAAQC
jgi:hypothetical protein